MSGTGSGRAGRARHRLRGGLRFAGLMLAGAGLAFLGAASLPGGQSRLGGLGGLGGLGAAAIPAAAAQTPNPRESGVEAVRRRQREQGLREGRSTAPYWRHFELMNTGQCAEALPGLAELARRGRGYENAQHALGLCLLETGRDAEGLEWIARAADAGLAAAQASHVRLFVKRGPAYMAPVQAAMWLHLYDTNPMRLLVGTGHALEAQAREEALTQIPRAAWLEGVARARHWTPRFADPAAKPGRRTATAP